MLPDQQMVVVFVSGFSGEDMEYVPDSLLNTYIIPAAQSERALPANSKQAELLAANLQEIAAPKSKPIRLLPSTAERITGRRYAIEANSLGISRMSWHFAGNQAWVEVALGGGTPMKYEIGLDDVYCATTVHLPGSPPVTYYQKGVWVSDEMFILYVMRNGAGAQMKIVFKDNGLELNIYAGGGVETVAGHLINAD